MKTKFTLLFFVIININQVYSQDKLTLDSSFGNFGRQVITNPYGSKDFYPQAQQIFMQDGSIINLVDNLTIEDYAYYMKTKPDGSLDLSFGNKGLFKFKFGGNFSDIFSLNSLKSSFLVTGFQDTFGFVMKVKNNGTLDSNFGVNGIIKDSIKGLNFNTTIINDSNYIIQHLSWSNFKYKFKKVNFKGILDTIFSSNFESTLSNFPKYDFDQFFVQNENEILVKFRNDSIIKINGKGQRINNFMFNGKISDSITVLGMEFVEPDINNYILVYGNYNTTKDTNNNYYIAKINSDGSLDKSFNEKGYISMPSINKRYGIISNRNFCNWFKINNYIYLITEESYNTSFKRERVITRFNINGTLDTTFYKKGRWVVDTLESTSLSRTRMKPLMNSLKKNNKFYLFGKDSNNYTFKMFKVTSSTLSPPVSIYSNQELSKLAIYPNPIYAKEFNLSLESNASNDLEIALFNLEGKKVFDFNKSNMIFQKNEVKLFLPQDIEAGNYFIKGKFKNQLISNSIIVY